MADPHKKQHNDQQEQCNTNHDNNISSLIEQIYEQLVCIIVFFYIEYPWISESSSIRLVDVCLYIFYPLGFTMPLRDLLESNKFYPRKPIYNKDKQIEKSFFEIDLICRGVHLPS